MAVRTCAGASGGIAYPAGTAPAGIGPNPLPSAVEQPPEAAGVEPLAPPDAAPLPAL
jgi:hypothetical protein